MGPETALTSSCCTWNTSGDVFGGHGFGQACTFLVAIRHDRLLYLAVDLLLDAIGSHHKAVKGREVKQQTHQANAAGAHFGAHQVNGDNQAMQEGKPRGTVKKGDNRRVLVEALVVGSPGLQGAARHLKRLGRLTQGEPLGMQLTILIEELSTWGATPVLGAIIIALCTGLDYGSHSDLLFHPSPLLCEMAQDGEVTN
jgi:hypothetical protein